LDLYKTSVSLPLETEIWQIKWMRKVNSAKIDSYTYSFLIIYSIEKYLFDTQLSVSTGHNLKDIILSLQNRLTADSEKLKM